MSLRIERREPLYGKGSFIVLVDPTITHVENRRDGTDREPDLAVWLVQEAMDDRTRMSVRRVLKHIAKWKGCEPIYMPPEAAVICALYHENTPYGLGYRLPQWHKFAWIVAYKDRCYLKRRNGTMVPTEGDGVWPTNEVTDKAWWLRLCDRLDAEGQDTRYIRARLSELDES